MSQTVVFGVQLRVGRPQVQHLDALRVDSQQVEAAGKVRRLAPAISFVLQGHSIEAAAPLVCLRVHHQAHNNLDADMASEVERLLGAVAQTALGPDVAGSEAAGTDHERIENTSSDRLHAWRVGYANRLLPTW